MLHLRAIVPHRRVDTAISLLLEHPAVTNLVVLPDAAREPPGDVVLCDIVREETSDVIGMRRDLGVEESGSPALTNVEVMLSEAAREAEKAAPGYGADTVVWEEVEVQTNEEATLSGTFLAFLTVAMLIAGVGVLLDQPVLIWHPTALSFVVAFLAGVAGTLSLTSSKSGALIGVLISVTTVPAAANGAVAIAFSNAYEMIGAFTQLGINISAILCAGTLTLLVQKVAWAEVLLPRRRPQH
ncbi:MAG: DUF389 domain-containing protein [Streptosporangiaceae bacterium]